MKRIISFLMALVMCSMFGTALAERKFDTTVFQNNGWKVSADDMEQRAFISYSKIYSADMTQKEYIYSNEFGSRHIKVKPDLYLAKYGTSSMVPYPRIWFDMHSKYNVYGWLMVQSVIIKVDDKTYTFSGNNFGNTKESKSWYYGSGWTTENFVCVCTDTEFMDAWIATTSQVKVRLKGNSNQFDFYLPSGSVQAIREMFKCFRDAGGYDYFRSSVN